ncbi:MAG: hypothetical protein ACI4QM_03000 [Alphaproteobacteria bacterium]
MTKLKRYIQLSGMLMPAAFFYHLSVEELSAYVWLFVLCSIAEILAFIVPFKRVGWLVVLLMGISVGFPAAAYDIIDCQGTHEGKSALSLFLSGRQAQALAQVAQDNTTGGNIVVSDFKDKKVLACVLVNITNLRSELCGADMASGKCDGNLQRKAFYVEDNFLRMNKDEATDNVGSHDWSEDGIAEYNDQRLMDAYRQSAASDADENDASRVYECAHAYAEYCADIEQKEMKKCRTIVQTMQKDTKECWVCDLVALVLISIQKLAGSTYILMRDLALGLLGVMFLFWIAFKVLKLIGQMGAGDFGGFFTEFLMRIITVAIAAAVLHAPIVDFYRIAISPFVMISAGLYTKLSDAMIMDGQTSFADKVRNQLKITPSDETCFSSCERLKKGRQSQGNATSGEEGTTSAVLAVLDDTSIDAFQCITCTAYNQVTPFIAIGESMNCYAIVEGIKIPGLPLVIPKLHYLLLGSLLIISFSVIACIVAFYIIDVMLKLGFIIVLTPLLITAWAFPISREYATRGWQLVLYCLLQLIGLAISMSLFGVIFTQFLPGDTTDLINYMAQNNVKDLFRVFWGMDPDTGAMVTVGVMIWGTGGLLVAGGLMLLMFIFVTLLSFKLITATDSVVSALSGISPGIPGVSFGALKEMTQETVAIGGAAVGVSSKVGSKVSGKVGAQVEKSAQKRRFEHKPGGTSDSGGNGAKPTTGRRFGEKVDSKIKSAGEKIGNGMERAGHTLGNGISSTGQSVTRAGARAGRGLMNNGARMMATGPIGAIVGGAMMAAGALVTAVSMGIGAGIRATGGAVNGISTVAGKGIKAVSGSAARSANRKVHRGVDTVAGSNNNGIRRYGYSKISQGAREMQKGSFMNRLKGLGTVVVGAAVVMAAKMQRGTYRGMGRLKRAIKNRTIRSNP